MIAFSSTAWRDAATVTMKAAATALGCGPVPKECAAAVPKPIGRPGLVCPATPDRVSVDSLGVAVVALARARLSATQLDLLWSRAFEINWKTLEDRYPDVPPRTLHRQYRDALATFAKSLRRLRK